MHKLVMLKKPNSLMKLFRMNRIGRTSNKLSLINGVRTKRAKKSILSKATRLYNTIPATLKSLSPKLLKIKLKQIQRRRLKYMETRTACIELNLWLVYLLRVSLTYSPDPESTFPMHIDM